MSEVAKIGKPLSVLCLITSLDSGGAQTMLYGLLSRLDRTKFRAQVVALGNLGIMSAKVQALGIPVRTLGMHRGRPNPMAVLRLAHWLRQDQPDVIQTWMYHADLVGALAARLARCIPVAWGIHQSNLSSEANKYLTLLTVKVCAYLSRWLPKRIVCCSEAARQVHAAVGYAAEKMVVIPNGYDIETFRPDSVARESVRKELHIPPDAPVIGLVARFDPQKDHSNFVRAAGLLRNRRPDVRFVLCGLDVNWENKALAHWIDKEGIRKQCYLLGQRDDIPRLTASFDIATLASFGEAFPNVVSEAMSCGIPCVVTDVGDSARIVGETGLIVPPRNPIALAEAWQTMLNFGREDRIRLGRAARERIKEQFNLPKIVARYERLFNDIAHQKSISP